MIIDIICLISNIKRRTLQSAHMSCVWKVRRHVHFGFTMFGSNSIRGFLKMGNTQEPYMVYEEKSNNGWFGASSYDLGNHHLAANRLNNLSHAQPMEPWSSSAVGIFATVSKALWPPVVQTGWNARAQGRKRLDQFSWMCNYTVQYSTYMYIYMYIYIYVYIVMYSR